MPMSYKYSAFQKFLDRQQNWDLILNLLFGRIMENKASYKECLKKHADFDGKADGCQEFWKDPEEEWGEFICSVCCCHQNYHREVIETTPLKYVPEVVYTKCNQIHNFGSLKSVDGCQKFIPGIIDNLSCAVCSCHKGFHRNEITKE